MHNGVPDNEGTGGEFSIDGRGIAIDDPDTRSTVADAASYTPAERHVLFELHLSTARRKGYGDVQLPSTRTWSADRYEREAE